MRFSAILTQKHVTKQKISTFWRGENRKQAPESLPAIGLQPPFRTL
jgi:hypothetical protein